MQQLNSGPTSNATAHIPDESFIREKQLLALQFAPFSSSTLWRKVKSGDFPAPVKISAQITAWRAGLLREWAADPAGYKNRGTRTNKETGAVPRSEQQEIKQVRPKGGSS